MADHSTDGKQELAQLRARIVQLERDLERERAHRPDAPQASDSDAVIAQLRREVEQYRRLGQSYRESEQRFRRMVENVRGMIICRGVKGGNQFGYDTQGVSLFGVDTDRISGSTHGGKANLDGWYNSIHPEDRPAYIDAERRRKELGEPYTLEYRFTHPKTGEGRWARETGWIVEDSGTGETFYDSCILDITDQKRLEQELRRSQRQLERAQKLAGIGHWVWRPDKVRGEWASGIEYSPSGGAIFGVSPAELSISSATLIERFVHPEDQRQVRHEYKNYAERRMLRRPLEYRIIRADGAVRNIVEITEDAVDEETGASYVIGTIQDITEQRASEHALRTSESRLKVFLENVPLAVNIKSVDGRYIMVNRGTADMLRRSAESIIGRRDTEMLPEATLRAVAALDDEVVRTSTTVQREVSFADGGRQSWFLATKFPIRDDAFTVVAVGSFYLDITDRKQADEAIRDREATIERAQQIAKLGHWQWRRRPGGSADDGEYVYSRSAADMLGLPAAELANLSDGDYIDQLVHPEDRERVRACIKESYLSSDATSVSVVCRIVRPDGGARTVREVVERVLDANGNLESMLGTLQDITEQKKIEDALRDSQAMLQTTIDAIPAIINVKDRNGCFVLVNAYQAAHAKISADDMIGRRAIDVYGEDHGRRSAARERLVIESGRGSGLTEEEMTEADGGKTVWLTNRAPIQDSAGHVKHILGVALDITELKRAEAARLESEVRLRTFLDRAPIAATIKDRDGRYIMVNREAEKLFDVPIEQVIGALPSDLLGSELAAESVALDRKILQTGDPIRGERHRAGRPSYEWTIYTKFPIRDSDGRITGIGGIHVDVGERKQLEAQLTQAQKMEAIGQLTGGIAHDFNNLLGIILGNLELLAEAVAAETNLSRYAGTAIGAANRGADLTRQLLTFARRQALQPRRLNVIDLINGMQDMFHRSLGAPIEIEYDLSASLWPIRADPSQLESALLNLALNARDAMPGGGKLTIAARNLRRDEVVINSGLAPGDYVELSVSDTGFGIPPENLNRVFEPFFTTKEVGHGSGLGLSMVYGFVRQSGGHVSIASTVGSGTTIRLHLPRDQSLSEMNVIGRDENIVAPRGSELLLVVEDNDDMRETAISNLSALGYKTLEAADGKSALSIIEANRSIDLLFTDISLPGGLNGWQIADEARRRRPEIKVLYTSGYPEATAPKSSGGTKRELLKKPYRKNDLAFRLRQILDAPPN